jgi:hypothetical protein
VALTATAIPAGMQTFGIVPQNDPTNNSYTNSSFSNNEDGSGGFSVGQEIRLEYDADIGQAKWYKNGTNYKTCNSLTGTQIVGLTGYYYNECDLNFGQWSLTYAANTGFKALCTANLPEPSIKDGSKYFQAQTYTGNGSSSQEINLLGNSTFQPDLIWIKARNVALQGHQFVDTVRGGGKRLDTSSTDAEYSNFNIINSFDADGWTFGSTTNGWNGSSYTYVGWCWKANGSGSTNNDGNNQSTVSVNSTAGFSIVKWVQDSGSDRTVGHGLGSAPAFMITKAASHSGYNWMMYHHKLDATSPRDYFLRFTTDSRQNVTNWCGSSLTTTFRTNSILDPSDTGIAYCWKEMVGYSKFGSYTGNNNTDGPFIYCGFKPKYVLIKCSSTTGDWIIHDTSRDPYNYTRNTLFPNTYGSESDGYYWDILSNGFKLRSSDAAVNGSNTYIYAAFAEHPFGGANTTPITAR